MFTIRFIISFFRLLRYSKILQKAYREDLIIEKLSYTLGVQFKKGPFAQLYAVINPYIKNGKYSPEQIMELNNQGILDDTMWMEKWTFERLNIFRRFIAAENLLDVLTFEMSDVGESNYLFIIKPVVFQETFNNFRSCCWELLALIILAGALLIIL